MVRIPSVATKQHVTHVIGGRRIEEASGEGPSADPLDRDDGSSSSSRPPDVSRLRKSALGMNATKSASVQKSAQIKKDSTGEPPAVDPSKQTRKPSALLKRKRGIQIVRALESDSDKSLPEKKKKKKSKPTFARKQGTVVDFGESDEESSDGTDHDYSSDVTEPPSETTSGGEDFDRKSEDKTAGSSVKKSAPGGSCLDSPCEYCGRRIYVTRPGSSARFCSKSCARRYNVGFSSRMGLFKRDAEKPPAVKKKPGRPFGSKSKPKPSPARKSDRIKEKEHTFPPFAEYFGGDDSNDSFPPQKTSRSGSTASTSKKEPLVPKSKSVVESQNSKKSEKAQLKSQPLMRDSPEIQAPLPSSSNNSSMAATPSPAKSAEKANTEDVNEKTAARRTLKRSKSSIGHLSPVARTYISEKPDNVKMLITEKPVVSWDYSEVAAFVGSVPGLENLAITMLTEQIDGQCLLLFDDNTWRKGFNIKMGPCLKLTKEIKTLAGLQRKEVLKTWYDERPAQFTAAVAHLEANKNAT